MAHKELEGLLTELALIESYMKPEFSTCLLISQFTNG